MEYRLTAPMTREQARQLRCGDTVLFTGTIYTARDAAHKRLVELLDRGEPLPFDVNGAVIYYAGPTPAQKGHAVGSCGPTTSYRMDAYAPKVIAAGSTGMIGKGKRDQGVVNAMKEYGAVYFAAIGGAGALLARCVKKAEVVAYEDLGAEAIRRMEVEDFPVTVVIATLGRNLYETGRKAYLASREKI